MRTGILGVFLSSSCFLTACAFSFPDYPERWAAPLDAPDVCATLAGSYENLGAFGNRDEYTGKEKPQLRYFLFENAKTLNELDRIEFAFGPDSVLRVRALDGEKLLRETSFSEKARTLNCSTDSAEIRSYSGVTHTAGNPLIGYEQYAVSLLKAKDGALVVKTSSSGYGMAYFIVPAGGSVRSWYRFPASQ